MFNIQKNHPHVLSRSGQISLVERRPHGFANTLPRRGTPKMTITPADLSRCQCLAPGSSEASQVQFNHCTQPRVRAMRVIQRQLNHRKRLRLCDETEHSILEEQTSHLNLSVCDDPDPGANSKSYRVRRDRCARYISSETERDWQPATCQTEATPCFRIRANALLLTQVLPNPLWRSDQRRKQGPTIYSLRCMDV